MTARRGEIASRCVCLSIIQGFLCNLAQVAQGSNGEAHTQGHLPPLQRQLPLALIQDCAPIAACAARHVSHVNCAMLAN